MPIRVARQCETALHLARNLESHTKVKKVSYPFLTSHPQFALAQDQMRFGGSLIAVELDTDFTGCDKFVSRLQLAHIATSFGGPETLVCHPATSTHVGLDQATLEAVGVTQGLLRFSIGLENSEDLLADFTQALNAL